MPYLLSKRIICSPQILQGKPIIRGTRISVEFILELLHSGMPFDEILKEYKQLTKPDLEAAIAFAKHAISKEEIIPFEFVHAR